MTDVRADQREEQYALRHDVAAVRLPRDVVRATGADALTFLQGQLSQDVDAMAEGEVAPALLLEPGGKVVAWLRVWRRAGGEVLMDVDAGSGQAVLDRLDRFKLRVQVDLELLTWELVSVRGPRTREPNCPPTVLPVPVDWAGLRGLDLLGPEVSVPQGVREVGPEALHAVRVEAGWPAMGAELGPQLDPLVIPAEAGTWLVDASVSFTKGCYTGQELVARVDSRGSNTPRHLRGLLVTSDVVPGPGAEVLVDGQDRGALTSVAWSAELNAAVALGYLHRSVEPGRSVVLRWLGDDGQPVVGDAVVRDLPLVSG
jgi:folate-binding protein YgfZ